MTGVLRMIDEKTKVEIRECTAINNRDDEISGLQRQIRELRDALKPFAQFSARRDELFHYNPFDDAHPVVGIGAASGVHVTINEGDFRRARVALAKEDGGAK